MEGNWLADLLVACVCRMKGISGETLISLVNFFQDYVFFVVEKLLGFFSKLSHVPSKKGKCWYSFPLFFKLCIEQWL